MCWTHHIIILIHCCSVVDEASLLEFWKITAPETKIKLYTYIDMAMSVEAVQIGYDPPPIHPHHSHRIKTAWVYLLIILAALINC